MSNEAVVEAATAEADKWRREHELKERETRCKEREQDLKEKEHELKRRESSRVWLNPVVIAIVAATIAGIANGIAVFLNGRKELELHRQKADAERVQEKSKAESARILEVLKPTDPEVVAVNLQFLLDTHLISDPDTRSYLESYLKRRPRGTGPSTSTSERPVVDNRLKFSPSVVLRGKVKLQLDTFGGPMARLQYSVFDAADKVLMASNNNEPLTSENGRASVVLDIPAAGAYLKWGVQALRGAGGAGGAGAYSIALKLLDENGAVVGTSRYTGSIPDKAFFDDIIYDGVCVNAPCNLEKAPKAK